MEDLENTIKIINKERLSNKNKWWIYFGSYKGIGFKIKAYNTWVQIFETDNFKDSSGMDISVSDFKKYLFETLENLEAAK